MQVSFEIADIMTCDLRPNFYDVIYSRDTILHIEDKLTLFKRQVLIFVVQTFLQIQDVNMQYLDQNVAK